MSEGIKDNDLSKVSGGTGEGTYKYVLCDRDWVYDNPYKTITVHIEQNISTNDKDALVRVVKRTKGETSFDDGVSGRIDMPVKHILSRYENYGGQLHNM